MGSHGHQGNPDVIVGYKIYYHDGSGESFDAEGNIVLPLVNLQIVTVPPSIPFVDWVGQWAVAPDTNLQVVSAYTDFTYIKDLTDTLEQARRVHEMITRKAWYYLDVSQGATLAAFKFADALNQIPAPLRPLAKQGKEIDDRIWHAVYDAAYEDWGIA